MIKFYIEILSQHPLTGDAEQKIFDITTNCFELEKVLRDRESTNRGEERKIIGYRLIDFEKES